VSVFGCRDDAELLEKPISLFDHFSASLPSSIPCVTVAVVSSLFPVLGFRGDPLRAFQLREAV
jgi:hypothetical protein